MQFAVQSNHRLQHTTCRTHSFSQTLFCSKILFRKRRAVFLEKAHSLATSRKRLIRGYCREFLGPAARRTEFLMCDFAQAKHLARRQAFGLL